MSDAPAPRRRVREAPPTYGPRRLLLDTNAWLWWQAGQKRLGARARHKIKGADDVRVSIATVWEISIKQALGKLTLPRGGSIADELAIDGFLPLPISMEHAMAVRDLPHHHRDPFDRMLVAQAQVEGLAIVTADRNFLPYDVAVIDATQ